MTDPLGEKRFTSLGLPSDYYSIQSENKRNIDEAKGTFSVQEITVYVKEIAIMMKNSRSKIVLG